MESKFKFSKNLCRVCLTNQGSLISLFVHVLYEDEHTFNLWEVYEHCTNIEVNEEDELPKTVCESCLNEFVNVYRFITKCKLSIVHLESFFDSKSKPQVSCENVLDKTITDEGNTEIVEPCKKEPTSENLGPVIKAECVLEISSDGIHVDCEIEDAVLSEKENDTDDTDSNVNQVVVEDPPCSKLLKKEGFLCSVCSKRCRSLSRLTEHQRSHTKEKPYRCNKCDAEFSLTSNLIRHNRIHSGEQPHVCHLCNKGFSQYSSLANHLSLHTGKEPYVCRCGKSFHSDRICTSALRGYRKKELKSKIKDMCKECDTIYTEACHYNNHTVYEGDSKRRYVCSICNKAYVSKPGLDHHNLMHTGVRPFECKICEKSFKSRNALQIHTLTHTGERPNVCAICGKCFVQSAHLTSHSLLHSGVKAYLCTFCNKSFALKGNLTQHLRIHNDETPYQCTVCLKKFRGSNNLKKHARSHPYIKMDSIRTEIQ